MAEPDYTRLHITPLNPTLLSVIIPPSILPNACNISYHKIETFPEKAYGYVDLPKMDAEKIKRKLNGSILKGVKVKIEAAKPKKELIPDVEEPAKPKKEKEKTNSKKRKRGNETIPAIDIGGRSIKRGWTTPASATSKKETSKSKNGKKPVVKSKYTTLPECLFKTALPPNVAAHTGKREGNPEKKRRKSDKGSVVHEFEKTTKFATFLRGPAGPKKTKRAAEFVEGKGWVDEDGNIVEEKLKKQKSTMFPTSAEQGEVEPEHKASKSESSEAESEDEPDAAVVEIPPQVPQTVKQDSPISSSGSSSEECGHSASGDDLKGGSSTPKKTVPDPSTLPLISKSRPQSSSGPPSGLNITIQDSTITSNPKSGELHPLEAIYKRPRPESLGSLPQLSQSTFTFFGVDGDEDLEEGRYQDQVPLTPFTQKDFEFRSVRSAAPTPDTAHVNERFIWPTPGDEDDEEEEISSPIRKESPAKTMDAKTGEAESDFQKWFYENRGETSRAWKKRRKAVAKEKRQRENRKRNERSF